MTPFVSQVTGVLSALTVASDVLITLVVILAIVRKSGSQAGNAIFYWLGRNAILFSFLVALTAMLSSLFYSDVAGFTPCLLCWWQRIFLFPQVFILGLALARKNVRAGAYALLLSVLGAAIAAYHTFIQFGGSPFLPCSASSISCAERYFLSYGYVTIPTMSLTAFLFIIVLMVLRNPDRKSA